MSSLSIFWVAISFLSGSVPYSVIIGHLAGAGDIRAHGDGNPGATNVGRALGKSWFVIAMLLDSFKGAVPVWWAFYSGQATGWELAAVAVAPILGHAFSPWLKLRGGKAVAVTFGAWAGLTLAAGPILLGILLTLAYKTVSSSGWAVMLAFGGLGVFILLFYAPTRPEFMLVWAGNALILAIKHIEELRQPPGFKPNMAKRIQRK